MTETRTPSLLFMMVMEVSFVIGRSVLRPQINFVQPLLIGGSIAKYSGQHVHMRLAGDEAYVTKDYRTALKKAFLGTDDDLRTGLFFTSMMVISFSYIEYSRSRFLPRSLRLHSRGCLDNFGGADLLRAPLFGCCFAPRILTFVFI